MGFTEGWVELRFTVGWVEMGFTVGWVEMGFTVGWVEMGFTVGWVEMGFTVGMVEMGFTLGWVEGRECKLSSAQVLHPWALTNKRYSVCFSSVTGSIFKPRFRLHLGTVQ